jgi:hypothetical protein
MIVQLDVKKTMKDEIRVSELRLGSVPGRTRMQNFRHEKNVLREAEI